MSNYEAVYEELFVRNLRRYASIRKAIKRRVERVLETRTQTQRHLAISAAD